VQLGGEAVDRDGGRSYQSMPGAMRLLPDCAVVEGMWENQGKFAEEAVETGARYEAGQM
jgi:hypothetical protein